MDAEFYPNLGPDDFRPPLVIASFKKVPLEEALEKLARTHDVNIVLDVRAGEAARAPVSADLTNVPLDTAVWLLADMAGLKSLRRENVVYVTTPANAAALQRERERKSLGPLGGLLPGKEK
jgi:type II secretory pathway component HofQ